LPTSALNKPYNSFALQETYLNADRRTSAGSVQEVCEIDSGFGCYWNSLNAVLIYFFRGA